MAQEGTLYKKASFEFLHSLAQWLNGMSHTVTSLLIPIQLCGGKENETP